MIKNKFVKIFLLFIIMCFAIFSLIGCDKEEGDSPITSLVVSTLPKTSYYKGDIFDVGEAQLTVYYENGSAIVVPLTMNMISNFDSNKIGKQVLTVFYNNATTSITVTVSVPPVYSIQVISMPTKTTYIIGETLDVSGLEVLVTFSNGFTEKKTVSEDMVTAFSTENEGETEMSIEYQGKFCSVPYTVEKKKPVNIQLLTTNSFKMNYVVNETLDLYGGSFFVSYNDKTEDTIPLQTLYDNGELTFTIDKESSNVFTTVSSPRTVIFTYAGEEFRTLVTVSELKAQGVSIITKPSDQILNGSVDLTKAQIYVSNNSAFVGYKALVKDVTAQAQQDYQKGEWKNTFSKYYTFDGKNYVNATEKGYDAKANYYISTEEEYKDSFETRYKHLFVKEGENYKASSDVYSDSRVYYIVSNAEILDFTDSRVEMDLGEFNINSLGKYTVRVLVDGNIYSDYFELGVISPSPVILEVVPTVRIDSATNTFFVYQDETIDITTWSYRVKLNNGHYMQNSSTGTNTAFVTKNMYRGKNEDFTQHNVGTFVYTLHYSAQEGSNEIVCDVPIEIRAKSIIQLDIVSPTKTVYSVGDTLNLSGGYLKVTYVNGDIEEDVPVTEDMIVTKEGATASLTEFTTEVSQNVTVYVLYRNAYLGVEKKAEFSIVVINKAIAIAFGESQGVKDTFILGEKFVTENWLVIITYSDGTKSAPVRSFNTKEWSFEGTQLDTTGEHTVLLYYGDKNDNIFLSFECNVTNDIVSSTLNTDFLGFTTEGTAFKTDGLTLTVTRQNGDKEELAVSTSFSDTGAYIVDYKKAGRFEGGTITPYTTCPISFGDIPTKYSTDSWETNYYYYYRNDGSRATKTYSPVTSYYFAKENFVSLQVAYQDITVDCYAVIVSRKVTSAVIKQNPKTEYTKDYVSPEWDLSDLQITLTYDNGTTAVITKNSYVVNHISYPISIGKLNDNIFSSYTFSNLKSELTEDKVFVQTSLVFSIKDGIYDTNTLTSSIGFSCFKESIETISIEFGTPVTDGDKITSLTLLSNQTLYINEGKDFYQKDDLAHNDFADGSQIKKRYVEKNSQKENYQDYMFVKVVYEGGEKEYISIKDSTITNSPDFAISGYDVLKTGSQTATVDFLLHSCTFSVYVRPNVITQIEVVDNKNQIPDTITLIEGMDIDSSVYSIRASYVDASGDAVEEKKTIDFSDVTCTYDKTSEITFTSRGADNRYYYDQPISVSFLGCSFNTLTLHILKKSATKIIMKTLPQTVYTELPEDSEQSESVFNYQSEQGDMSYVIVQYDNGTVAEFELNNQNIKTNIGNFNRKVVLENGAETVQSIYVSYTDMNQVTVSTTFNVVICDRKYVTIEFENEDDFSLKTFYCQYGTLESAGPRYSLYYYPTFNSITAAELNKSSYQVMYQMQGTNIAPSPDWPVEVGRYDIIISYDGDSANNRFYFADRYIEVTQRKLGIVLDQVSVTFGEKYADADTEQVSSLRVFIGNENGTYWRMSGVIDGILTGDAYVHGDGPNGTSGYTQVVNVTFKILDKNKKEIQFKTNSDGTYLLISADAGEYTIVPTVTVIPKIVGSQEVYNYVVDAEVGSKVSKLTIQKKNVSVVALPQTKKYGEADTLREFEIYDENHDKIGGNYFVAIDSSEITIGDAISVTTAVYVRDDVNHIYTRATGKYIKNVTYYRVYSGIVLDAIWTDDTVGRYSLKREDEGVDENVSKKHLIDFVSFESVMKNYSCDEESYTSAYLTILPTELRFTGKEAQRSFGTVALNFEPVLKTGYTMKNNDSFEEVFATYLYSNYKVFYYNLLTKEVEESLPVGEYLDNWAVLYRNLYIEDMDTIIYKGARYSVLPIAKESGTYTCSYDAELFDSITNYTIITEPFTFYIKPVSVNVNIGSIIVYDRSTVEDGSNRLFYQYFQSELNTIKQNLPTVNYFGNTLSADDYIFSVIDRGDIDTKCHEWMDKLLLGVEYLTEGGQAYRLSNTYLTGYTFTKAKGTSTGIYPITMEVNYSKNFSSFTLESKLSANSTQRFVPYYYNTIRSTYTALSVLEDNAFDIGAYVIVLPSFCDLRFYSGTPGNFEETYSKKLLTSWQNYITTEITLTGAEYFSLPSTTSAVSYALVSKRADFASKYLDAGSYEATIYYDFFADVSKEDKVSTNYIYLGNQTGLTSENIVTILNYVFFGKTTNSFTFFDKKNYNVLQKKINVRLENYFDYYNFGDQTFSSQIDGELLGDDQLNLTYQVYVRYNTFDVNDVVWEGYSQMVSDTMYSDKITFTSSMQYMSSNLEDGAKIYQIGDGGEYYERITSVDNQNYYVFSDSTQRYEKVEGGNYNSILTYYYFDSTYNEYIEVNPYFRTKDYTFNTAKTYYRHISEEYTILPLSIGTDLTNLGDVYQFETDLTPYYTYDGENYVKITDPETLVNMNETYYLKNKYGRYIVHYPYTLTSDTEVTGDKYYFSHTAEEYIPVVFYYEYSADKNVVVDLTNYPTGIESVFDVGTKHDLGVYTLTSDKEAVAGKRYYTLLNVSDSAGSQLSEAGDYFILLTGLGNENYCVNEINSTTVSYYRIEATTLPILIYDPEAEYPTDTTLDYTVTSQYTGYKQESLFGLGWQKTSVTEKAQTQSLNYGGFNEETNKINGSYIYLQGTNDTMICSDQYESTLDTTDVQEYYCDCNVFLLPQNREYLTRHSSANEYFTNSTTNAFDTLSELYATFIGWYNLTDEQHETNKNSPQWTAYIDFIEQVQDMYEDSPFVRSHGRTYDPNKSVVLGINHSFDITFGDGTGRSFTDMKKVVAHLFGFDTYESFAEKASSYADVVFGNGSEMNRVEYTGAVYTQNGSFILPYIFNGDMVVAFVVIDSQKNISVWVDNVDNAFEIVDFDNGIDDMCSVTMYGRCVLFETPRSSAYDIYWKVLKDDVNRLKELGGTIVDFDTEESLVYGEDYVFYIVLRGEEVVLSIDGDGIFSYTYSTYKSERGLIASGYFDTQGAYHVVPALQKSPSTLTLYVDDGQGNGESPIYVKRDAANWDTILGYEINAKINETHKNYQSIFVYVDQDKRIRECTGENVYSFIIEPRTLYMNLFEAINSKTFDGEVASIPKESLSSVALVCTETIADKYSDNNNLRFFFERLEGSASTYISNDAKTIEMISKEDLISAGNLKVRAYFVKDYNCDYEGANGCTYKINFNVVFKGEGAYFDSVETDGYRSLARQEYEEENPSIPFDTLPEKEQESVYENYFANLSSPYGVYTIKRANINLKFNDGLASFNLTKEYDGYGFSYVELDNDEVFHNYSGYYKDLYKTLVALNNGAVSGTIDTRYIDDILYKIDIQKYASDIKNDFPVEVSEENNEQYMQAGFPQDYVTGYYWFYFYGAFIDDGTEYLFKDFRDESTNVPFDNWLSWNYTFSIDRSFNKDDENYDGNAEDGCDGIYRVDKRKIYIGIKDCAPSSSTSTDYAYYITYDGQAHTYSDLNTFLTSNDGQNVVYYVYDTENAKFVPLSSWENLYKFFNKEVPVASSGSIQNVNADESITLSTDTLIAQNPNFELINKNVNVKIQALQVEISISLVNTTDNNISSIVYGQTLRENQLLYNIGVSEKELEKFNQAMNDGKNYSSLEMLATIFNQGENNYYLYGYNEDQQITELSRFTIAYYKPSYYVFENNQFSLVSGELLNDGTVYYTGTELNVTAGESIDRTRYYNFVKTFEPASGSVDSTKSYYKATINIDSNVDLASLYEISGGQYVLTKDTKRVNGKQYYSIARIYPTEVTLPEGACLEISYYGITDDEYFVNDKEYYYFVKANIVLGANIPANMYCEKQGDVYALTGDQVFLNKEYYLMHLYDGKVGVRVYSEIYVRVGSTETYSKLSTSVTTYQNGVSYYIFTKTPYSIGENVSSYYFTKDSDSNFVEASSPLIENEIYYLALQEDLKAGDAVRYYEMIDRFVLSSDSEKVEGTKYYTKSEFTYDEDRKAYYLSDGETEYTYGSTIPHTNSPEKSFYEYDTVRGYYFLTEDVRFVPGTSYYYFEECVTEGIIPSSGYYEFQTIFGLASDEMSTYRLAVRDVHYVVQEEVSKANYTFYKYDSSKKNYVLCQDKRFTASVYYYMPKYYYNASKIQGKNTIATNTYYELVSGVYVSARSIEASNYYYTFAEAKVSGTVPTRYYVYDENTDKYVLPELGTAENGEVYYSFRRTEIDATKNIYEPYTNFTVGNTISDTTIYIIENGKYVRATGNFVSGTNYYKYINNFSTAYMTGSNVFSSLQAGTYYVVADEYAKNDNFTLKVIASDFDIERQEVTIIGMKRDYYSDTYSFVFSSDTHVSEEIITMLKAKVVPYYSGDIALTSKVKTYNNSAFISQSMIEGFNDDISNKKYKLICSGNLSDGVYSLPLTIERAKVNVTISTTENVSYGEKIRTEKLKIHLGGINDGYPNYSNLSSYIRNSIDLNDICDRISFTNYSENINSLSLLYCLTQDYSQINSNELYSDYDIVFGDVTYCIVKRQINLNVKVLKSYYKDDTKNVFSILYSDYATGRMVYKPNDTTSYLNYDIVINPFESASRTYSTLKEQLIEVMYNDIEYTSDGKIKCLSNNQIYTVDGFFVYKTGYNDEVRFLEENTTYEIMSSPDNRDAQVMAGKNYIRIKLIHEDKFSSSDNYDFILGDTVIMIYPEIGSIGEYSLNASNQDYINMPSDTEVALGATYNAQDNSLSNVSYLVRLNMNGMTGGTKEVDYSTLYYDSLSFDSYNLLVYEENAVERSYYYGIDYTRTLKLYYVSGATKSGNNLTINNGDRVLVRYVIEESFFNNLYTNTIESRAFTMQFGTRQEIGNNGGLVANSIVASSDDIDFNNDLEYGKVSQDSNGTYTLYKNSSAYAGNYDVLTLRFALFPELNKADYSFTWTVFENTLIALSIRFVGGSNKKCELIYLDKTEVKETKYNVYVGDIASLFDGASHEIAIYLDKIGYLTNVKRVNKEDTHQKLSYYKPNEAYDSSKEYYTVFEIGTLPSNTLLYNVEDRYALYFIKSGSIYVEPQSLYPEVGTTYYQFNVVTSSSSANFASYYVANYESTDTTSNIKNYYIGSYDITADRNYYVYMQIDGNICHADHTEDTPGAIMSFVGGTYKQTYLCTKFGITNTSEIISNSTYKPLAQIKGMTETYISTTNSTIFNTNGGVSISCQNVNIRVSKQTLSKRKVQTLRPQATTNYFIRNVVLFPIYGNSSDSIYIVASATSKDIVSTIKSSIGYYIVTGSSDYLNAYMVGNGSNKSTQIGMAKDLSFFSYSSNSFIEDISELTEGLYRITLPVSFYYGNTYASYDWQTFKVLIVKDPTQVTVLNQRLVSTKKWETNIVDGKEVNVEYKLSDDHPLTIGSDSSSYKYFYNSSPISTISSRSQKVVFELTKSDTASSVTWLNLGQSSVDFYDLSSDKDAYTTANNISHYGVGIKISYQANGSHLTEIYASSFIDDSMSIFSEEITESFSWVGKRNILVTDFLKEEGVIAIRLYQYYKNSSNEYVTDFVWEKYIRNDLFNKISKQRVQSIISNANYFGYSFNNSSMRIYDQTQSSVSGYASDLVSYAYASTKNGLYSTGTLVAKDETLKTIAGNKSTSLIDSTGGKVYVLSDSYGVPYAYSTNSVSMRFVSNPETASSADGNFIWYFASSTPYLSSVQANSGIRQRGLAIRNYNGVLSFVFYKYNVEYVLQYLNVPYERVNVEVGQPLSSSYYEYGLSTDDNYYYKRCSDLQTAEEGVNYYSKFNPNDGNEHTFTVEVLDQTYYYDHPDNLSDEQYQTGMYQYLDDTLLGETPISTLLQQDSYSPPNSNSQVQNARMLAFELCKGDKIGFRLVKITIDEKAVTYCVIPVGNNLNDVTNISTSNYGSADKEFESLSGNMDDLFLEGVYYTGIRMTPNMKIYDYITY